ncbi:MAG: dephospho-CoA kinase [Pseudomonadota bacterium]|nr:MAG: dephospho-CoA kinase [Pseudomonadota bacterium]
MLIIGLTGGIGSGKSTVADMFTALGVPVIDTDDLARELVAPGEPALSEIVATFGASVLGPNRTLDRARMRELVFQSEDSRRKLESILHPRIRQLVRERVAELNAPYCVVVIPLLFESDQRDLVDRVLVVDTSEELQMARATQRDGAVEAQVSAIMCAQLGREARLAGADDILTNDAGLNELCSLVQDLHQRYLELSYESRKQ